ncbi:AAA-ATPase At3g50940 [Brachypodium distachyon]|uniref:AAA+ ATPase domain-containing protein n=1 Tax=Brachypodium distachyon TaxID=15368 RepID=I1HFV4_BRADI|nr:AAA-ATPase At3g50940 [Brachypodium distachyon]KQK04609.1 hypothetical protein BRADI_2g14610v3 [Brachypodium distachyon]|eukprot:XP_003565822.1 AAA-ATPase At3g50940 [Brachypodium distachyon]
MSSSSSYSCREYLTVLATAAGTAMALGAAYELRDMASAAARSFLARLSPRRVVVIDETDGLSPNRLFDAARSYLSSSSSSVSATARRLRATRLEDSSSSGAGAGATVVTIDLGEQTTDSHDGVSYTWRLLVSPNPGANTNNPHTKSGHGGHGGHAPTKSLELTFHKKHTEKALSSYIPHIISAADEIRSKNRALKMHMVEYDAWAAVDLRHPSTFATLAMPAAHKRSIIADLDRFVTRRDHYAKTGRAWKRGYLLHGPPGTGKSSLVAAMANHLRFDVYDLELPAVSSNSDLRRLLVGVANRSILLIEDIDRSSSVVVNGGGALRNHRDAGAGDEDEDGGGGKVTLSGLLNFVDGLWSTTGEERIVVFTTNHKERLDPALLRPGRMDVHVHMGFCTPESFRVLAGNYHSVEDHDMFPEIERLLEEVPVTPAEVAEVLMRNDGADAAFRDLLEFIEGKRMEGGESKE